MYKLVNGKKKINDWLLVKIYRIILETKKKPVKSILYRLFNFLVTTVGFEPTTLRVEI